MTLRIPQNLIFPDSRLRIWYEEDKRLNHRTKTAVVIEGTTAGFLSLANALLFFGNDLEDTIPIHELPFVDSEIELFTKCDYGETKRRYGQLSREADGKFVWLLTEDALALMASDVHSLGHLNPEVHMMDDDMTEEDISVYCVLE